MIAPSRVIVRTFDQGNLALSGAAPQTTTTKVFDCKGAAEGTLSCYVRWKITTNTLTYTLKWQVSVDGTTWDDVRPSNNAAVVTLATGTGGAVTAAVVLDAPASVYGYNNVRCIITTGVASAGGAGVDEIQAFNFSFRKPFNGN